MRTLRKNANNYHKMHRNIRVNVTPIEPKAYLSTLSNRFAEGQPPDFFYGFTDLNAKFEWEGWVGVIEDYIPEAAKYRDQVSNPQYRESILTADGRLLALAYYGDQTAFIYNKEHLEKAGFAEPPKDWNELQEQAKVVKAKDVCRFPIAAGLGSAGALETLYAFILGMNPPASSYLFDDAGNPLFDEENSPLYVALRWLLEVTHKDKTMTKHSGIYSVYTLGDAMAEGKHTFVWLPRYKLAVVNSPSGKVAGKAAQAVNPGYGYTTCYIRTYTVSKKALESGRQRLNELWKLLQYFGGKTNDRLEPDFEHGIYRVAKILAVDEGVPFAYDDLWADSEASEALGKLGSLEVYKEQNKKVFNSQHDPQCTPWSHEWNGNWGPFYRDRPLIKTLNSLLRRSGIPSRMDFLAALRDLAEEWKRLKKKYERTKRRR